MTSHLRGLRLHLGPRRGPDVTFTIIHAPPAANYSDRGRFDAISPLQIVIALLSCVFGLKVMIVRRHYVNAIKLFRSCCRAILKDLKENPRRNKPVLHSWAFK